MDVTLAGRARSTTSRASAASERRYTTRSCPVRAIHRRGAAAALAGFDDFELADALALPLTVVSYDMRELGRQAARLLCDRIDDPAGEPRRVVVPTTVVEYA